MFREHPARVEQRCLGNAIGVLLVRRDILRGEEVVPCAEQEDESLVLESSEEEQFSEVVH